MHTNPSDSRMSPVSTAEDRKAAWESTRGDPVQAQLKQRADRLRQRLAQTLESLEQRKHDAFDIKHQAKKHPLSFLLAGLGALVAFIGSIFFLVRKPKLPPPPLTEQRRAAEEVTADSDFARKAVLSLLSLVVAEAARFGFAKLNEKLSRL